MDQRIKKRKKKGDDLLPSPSLQQACCRCLFSLEAKRKKKGYDNKFVAIALFITTSTKEK
jgi:hypothetical protein